MKPKVIHTRTFSCADDHPIVYYTFDKNNKAMCLYCATHFIYEPTPSEKMQDKLEPIFDDVDKKGIMDDKTYNPEIDDVDYTEADDEN